MKTKIPNSPLSTALSGSAQAAEERIRNIFLGKRKRPPLLLLIVAALTTLLCGSLVSCQSGLASQSSGRTLPIEVSHILAEFSPGSIAPYQALAPEQTDFLEKLSLHPSSQGLPPETAALFPKTAINLADPDMSLSWENTIVLLSENPENDCSLYGVVTWSGWPANPENGFQPPCLCTDGIILRCGTEFKYYPLDWSSNAWRGISPKLWVSDFDRDGQSEAAVSLTSNHGTGVWIENLHIFELNSQVRRTLVPNISDLSSEYNADSNLLSISTSHQRQLSNIERLGYADDWPQTLTYGDIVRYQMVDGHLICQMQLSIGPFPIAMVEAPVLYQDASVYLDTPSLIASSWHDGAGSICAIDQFIWVSEQNGQVMQAASESEYAAGGSPFMTKDGHVVWWF